MCCWVLNIVPIMAFSGWMQFAQRRSSPNNKHLVRSSGMRKEVIYTTYIRPALWKLSRTIRVIQWMIEKRQRKPQLDHYKTVQHLLKLAKTKQREGNQVETKRYKSNPTNAMRVFDSWMPRSWPLYSFYVIVCVWYRGSISCCADSRLAAGQPDDFSGKAL